ncbi:hypothetical protein BBK36DRAFT_1120176 [Trichoderma citrinoviride]|uniref:Uncharacterized protein n=1 Tax=Trichoderma citrinoviride TaxID=58853 RepID=A0A2T4B954_9HYPO|nr:hypothetical protein BBK36DRAFT_1120176 [Trichoderma citrinoviride]PTB65749.1 hypothetical protein BBK36DRAFT_1120176 [Trichoderma citrinoviride]
MASQQITLFDLPSKGPNASWSLNPWKTRLLLTYKGLDYKTEWLNYPEIAPRLRPHLPPNETGRAYSIPAILFPDGTYMMDSHKIAAAIEQGYPFPPIHLEAPILPKIEHLTQEAIRPLYPLLMHKISQVILPDKSYDYWVGQYVRELGMPLDEYERQFGGEKAWAAARPALSELTELLKEAEGGPFFLGREVSYADFVWVGGLVFVKRVDEGVFRELLERTGAGEVHERLLEACEPWLKRND